MTVIAAAERVSRRSRRLSSATRRRCSAIPFDWHHDPVSGHPLACHGRLPEARPPQRARRRQVDLGAEPAAAPAVAGPGLAVHRATSATPRRRSTTSTWLEQNPPGRGIAWRGAFEAGCGRSRSRSPCRACGTHQLTPERYRRIVTMLAAARTAAGGRFPVQLGQQPPRRRARRTGAGAALPTGDGAALVARRPSLAPRGRPTGILPDGAGAEQAVGYQIFSGPAPGRGVPAQALGLGSNGPRSSPRSAAPYLGAARREKDPVPATAMTTKASRSGLDSNRLGPEVSTWGSSEGARRRAGTLTRVRLVSPRLVPDGRLGADAGRRTITSGQRPSGQPVRRARWAGRCCARRPPAHHGRRPLGYLSIAAHGHADALSVSCERARRELIGDPGRGQRRRPPGVAATHPRTRAHATVRVDGVTSRTRAGPFLWPRQAAARVGSGVDLVRRAGGRRAHGYQRLGGASPPPTLAARTARPSAWALVVDALDGVGQHEMRASWPLHPALDVHALPQGHEVVGDGVPVLLMACAATVPLVHEQVRGDEETEPWGGGRTGWSLDGLPGWSRHAVKELCRW